MEKVVALSCVCGLGMSFALLGSLSVKLIPRLERDTGRFGTLISSFMITSLVASLIMGVVVDSLGYKPVAVFGFVLTAAVLFMIARGITYNIVHHFSYIHFSN